MSDATPKFSRNQLFFAIGAFLLVLLLLAAVTCRGEAQTVTAKFASVLASPKPDSVKQTLSWTVSGVTPDSFVIYQRWSATGRNADANGAVESATGETRLRTAGSTRSKVLYWRQHYGNTELRSACVVPYKGGAPVGGGPTVVATAPTWVREKFLAYPPKGTADVAFLDTQPALVDTLTQLSFSTALQESYRVTSTAFTLPAGNYTFTVRADDGVRVYLDGNLIVDEYRPQSPTTFTRTVPVVAGTHHVTVVYFNNDASGVLAVSWAPVTAPSPNPNVTCAGALASYTLWQPWKDGVFLAPVDSAVARRGTIVLVGGWLPKRLTPRADSLCRQAAVGSGLAQVVDLRGCMAALDTAGAVLCMAVLDSAHSWGFTGPNNWPKCDQTFYRAIRGPRW